MIRSVLACFALCLIFTMTAAGQGNEVHFDTTTYSLYMFDIVGGGARAQGMGNAYLAVSDDASAASWNPAGLFVQEKPLSSFDWGSFMPRGEFFNEGLIYTQEGSFDNVGYASFISPLRIKGHPFVAAISYSRNSQDYLNGGAESVRDTLNNIFDTTQIHDQLLLSNHALLNSVSFAFGTRFYKDVSFGAAVNIYTGRAVINRFNTRTILGLIPQERPNQHVDYVRDSIEIDTSRYSGVNFTLGFRRDGERLDLGLVLRTPFTLKSKTGKSIYHLVTYGTPGHVATPQAQYSDTTFVDDFVTEVNMPLYIGAGVAYKPTEKSLLALDVEYRGFSGKTIKVRDSLRISPGGSNEEYFTEVNPNWNNVFAVRVGGEYVLTTNSAIAPRIPIRAGFGYVPTPVTKLEVPSEIQVLGTTNTNTAINVGVGAGIHWSQIYLDAAYMYTSSDYEDVSGVTLQSRNHQFNLMFTGYF
jgi:long-chain fatty acid transport protein